MEQILNLYYENNARKLHTVVDQIFYRKFGGTAGRDMDEFYSAANDVFADIVRKNRYDEAKGNFEGLLYGALELAIIDELKKQNCNKRKMKIEVKADGGVKRICIPDLYLDAPAKEDGDLTIGEVLPSGFDMEAEVFRDSNEFFDERMEQYLTRLSKIQRQMLQMKMEDCSVSEIKEKLGLTNKQYEHYMQDLKSFAKINILYRNENRLDLEEGTQMRNSSAVVTRTMEKSKSDRLSIASIIKKIDRHTLRFDHPLQRESEQWSPSMKGNLISDILQGNPIPALVFAEQVANGIAIIWDLDGKQRCTNAYSFTKDGYRITKNIRRWVIEYQTPVVDGKGQPVFDKNHFPVYEKKKFDIRGKKFSELPEELQDRFQDYNFEIVQYLNCSGDDIAYHIARYNEGKPMTASQKGITRLGEEFAGMVKSISNMPFFKDMGGYKVSEFKNGTVNRVVIESIMAADFINDWKKKQEDMCEFINKKASPANFDNFEDMVDRLQKVATDEIADMFNSRDSFLWFGLFARFIKFRVDDKTFVKFMSEFAGSLHKKKIGAKSFDDLNVKSTKDKNVVVAKMRYLEKMLAEYLKERNKCSG